VSFSELIILMVIALILFGPEDLPDIARAVGRIVFEVKKIAADMTREFQNAIDTPTNVLQKTFENTVNRPAPKEESKEEKGLSPSPSENNENNPSSKEDNEEILLSYDDEDPLADLPPEVISNEKKS
jgi:Tat protein translocase TatB subunit